jgi:peptide chain release factor 1
MTTLDPKLEAKLQAMRSRYEELGHALSEPDVVADLERYRTASKAYADLRPVVAMFGEHEKVAADLAGARELLGGSRRAPGSWRRT